ncbi:MAG: EAL domain-containing protein [Sulfuriflexus sp.]|nr:EAL domain-containing protein [Sulfuriflexus sp.]
MTHEQTPSPTTQSSGLLIVGFLMCIAVFTTLMGYGIYQLQEGQQDVRELALKFNTKSDLIVRMYNAARNRTIGLYAMVSTDDAFRYDELYVQFNSDGAKFAVARLALLEMVLSKRESHLLSEQSRYTNLAIPYQRDVIDLMYQDESQAALKLLTEEAVPAQNRTLQALRQLQEHQRISSAENTQQTQASQQKTIRVLFILGGLTILFSIIIAFYVVRRNAQIERNIYIEKEFAELTLRSIGDAIITTDPQGHVLIMNPNAEMLTGWSAAEAQDKSLDSIFHVVDELNHHLFINPLGNILATGEMLSSTESEILINRKGKEFGIEHSVAPIIGLNKEILGLIIIFRDVTETRALAKQLVHQATHDNLTGLVNRREFEIRLEHAFLNVRADNIEYALCFMDLDQFKLINDTCGHNAGDELLRQISTVLQQCVRRTDTLARLGGDEFGVLLESCSLQKAEQIAQILLRTINDFRFSWQGQSFDIGVSIGVAPITALTANISELLSAADTACYLAKDKGRNRIHVYHPDDSELEQHRGEVQWVQRINEALVKDHFILYYQPIVSLNEIDPAPTHYEILVRMTNEAGDLIPPMAFIPAAERYKLMPFIDQWVVHHSLLEINNIYNESGETYKKCVFTINISGQSLSANDFANYILSEIIEYKIEPSAICFEITETAAIANMSSAVDFITKLKKAGCRFALDDFGSGLSSFSYLKTLPVDYLKIDGSFVRDICDDTTDHAFVESITQIAHVMNIETIAEFVEGREILNELRNIGVDYAQGYYISTPAPLSAFQKNEVKREIS